MTPKANAELLQEESAGTWAAEGSGVLLGESFPLIPRRSSLIPSISACEQPGALLL